MIFDTTVSKLENDIEQRLLEKSDIKDTPWMQWEDIVTYFGSWSDIVTDCNSSCYIFDCSFSEGANFTVGTSNNLTVEVEGNLVVDGITNSSAFHWNYFV